MTVPEEAKHERRIAERRARALKRLKLEDQSQPLEVGTPHAHAAIAARCLKDLYYFLETSITELHPLRRGFLLSLETPPATVDVSDTARALRAAEAELREHLTAFQLASERLKSIGDPMELQAAICAVAALAAQAEPLQSRCAALAAEADAFIEENMSRVFATLASTHPQQIDEALAVVGAASAAARTRMAWVVGEAAGEMIRHRSLIAEERRAALVRKVRELREASDMRPAERAALREAHERGVVETWEQQHAAHDALWHQLSQRATDLACQLVAAKAKSMVTADTLAYNCRVLDARKADNKMALMQQKHAIARQNDKLATLRLRHAEARQEMAKEEERAAQEALESEGAVKALQEKEAHFTAVEEAEFQNLVALKEETAAALVRRFDYLKGHQQRKIPKFAVLF